MPVGHIDAAADAASGVVAAARQGRCQRNISVRDQL
jgi:hypothetical protein